MYVWKYFVYLCYYRATFSSFIKSAGLRVRTYFSNWITKRIKSNIKSCVLDLNDCSSPWWIYGEGKSCFYSQMKLFSTLIGAIKNDIFIFRLGGLTRTATVTYYRTHDGGFSEDLASLVVAVPRCTTSQWPVLNRAVMYVCVYNKNQGHQFKHLYIPWSMHYFSLVSQPLCFLVILTPTVQTAPSPSRPY